MAFPARGGQTELDKAVGFTGQILFVASKIPALVIGVIHNGQTSIQGFGRRADGCGRWPDGDTLFRVGSITKAFTGQVLASLAADGVVGLADPLTKYVPEFFEPLSEAGRPIRLIDLATHSAGLPREVRMARSAGRSLRPYHPRGVRRLAQSQSAAVHAGNGDLLLQFRLRSARRRIVGGGEEALSRPHR